jgi:glycerophosphoryl diester phosphodiesterase
MTILDDKFKIIAYRGGTEFFSENSIEAIQESLNANPETVIELDLQLTKDNFVIAFHDFHLDDLTNGQGNVCDFSLEELKRLFLKNSNKTTITTSKISTLEEIANRFPKQSFVLDLHENNKSLIDKIIEIVERQNLQERVAIVSIVDGLTKEFQKLRPNWNFVASPKETKKFILASKLFLDGFVKTTADIMFLPDKLGGLKILNSRMIQRLHYRNIKVWTCHNFKPYQNVNSSADLSRLKELGVDGVYTDNPKKIIA